MAKDNRYSFESWLHTIVHFLLVFFTIYLLVILPLGLSLILLAVWILQLKILGNCFLTRFAHYRGVMVGMSFWEYVPFLFRDKDYRRTGKYIDKVLKATITAIVVVRLIVWVKYSYSI